jgi:hypothetical protein
MLNRDLYHPPVNKKISLSQAELAPQVEQTQRTSTKRPFAVTPQSILKLLCLLPVHDNGESRISRFSLQPLGTTTFGEERVFTRGLQAKVIF